MEFKDLLAEHPYYCSDSNYYSNEAGLSYIDWESFIDDWENADVEYNHVFRFDVHEKREEDTSTLLGYRAEIFVMLQRKGKFVPILIDEVKPENFDSMKSFLEKHYNEVVKMWAPFSDLTKK